MVKILFPSSFELKTNQFSGKDFFWFWNSHISGLKKPITLTAMTLFLSSLVIGPKMGDTTKFRPGATIPSNATVVQYLYTYRWYSIYMPSSGTVSISKYGCCNGLCPLVNCFMLVNQARASVYNLTNFRFHGSSQANNFT